VKHWGIPDPVDHFGSQPFEARKARLSEIVQETGAKTIHYLYDFRDRWDLIRLEKWFDKTMTEVFRSRCCRPLPPEDVGGALGYADYLDAISDPTHPET
jgi:hypothetical protein